MQGSEGDAKGSGKNVIEKKCHLPADLASDGPVVYIGSTCYLLPNGKGQAEEGTNAN